MKFTPALLALAAALSTSVAHADEVEVFRYTGGTSFATADTNYGGTYEAAIPWLIGTYNPVSNPFRAGAGVYTVKDYTVQRSFLAFCLQPLTPLSAAAGNDFGVTTETYTSTTSGVNPEVQRLFDLWGWRVSLSLDRNLYDPASTTTGREYGAAMQLAIWNLVTDAGDYSMDSGTFKAFGSSGINGTIKALANQMLADVANPLALGGDPNNMVVGGIQRQTLVWNSANSQAMISNSGVIPEPSTYALIAAGLGVVAFAQRRRLTQAA
ncbi:MAG TPA: PEP-CTERM sorting domain-containing protein [Aquabacterium sp.]|uniref:PEP-CTERM sorting domain-containing protein n=1 Tax=Aquabacterium sp. TaxID=1872578 RepID=UPI002E2FF89E|nr:PEP-CTERM sorting domain-containing protein [Aquabacterium sp.]HEX5371807.1 PEP-CTERM sorting domain-containing protein [Aquabacterium sp.]